MNKRPMFESPQQAINTTFVMAFHLAGLASWAALVMLHLMLGLLALLALWWWQVTPAQVQSVGREALGSTTLAAAGAVGLSLLGLLTAYIAAVRWIWAKTFGQWLIEYLLRGATED